MDERLGAVVDAAVGGGGLVVWLTGAGISAESGIPTFRGPEGYWRVGSRNYRPEELATWEHFERHPDDVWAWYLYRRAVCRAAAPNAAHAAVAALEARLGDRFLLVTQNVDGLHLRAGNTLARTYQIHGNIDFLRCAAECGGPPVRIPDGLLDAWPKDRALGDAERAVLRCARCGGRARPHVLWFDETYDEERYRFESSQRAAAEAALLVVVGTSGATNLPLRMGAIAARTGAAIVAVSPDESPFTELAERVPRGVFVRSTAVATVPALCQRIAEAAA